MADRTTAEQFRQWAAKVDDSLGLLLDDEWEAVVGALRQAAETESALSEMGKEVQPGSATARVLRMFGLWPGPAAEVQP